MAKRASNHQNPVVPVFAQTRFQAFPLYSGRPWFLPIVHTAFALLDRVR